MIHAILVLLTYAFAVCETLPGDATVRPLWLLGLAAFVVVVTTFETALMWVTIIGIASDNISGNRLGTHVLAFVIATFAVRYMIPQLCNKPMHIRCSAALAFLVGATGCGFIITMATREFQKPNGLQFATSLGITWLIVVAAVGIVHGAQWLFARLRGPDNSGGAMGNPVGLSVN